MAFIKLLNFVLKYAPSIGANILSLHANSNVIFTYLKAFEVLADTIPMQLLKKLWTTPCYSVNLCDVKCKNKRGK